MENAIWDIYVSHAKYMPFFHGMYLALNRLYFSVHGFGGLIRSEILINFEQPIRGCEIVRRWLVSVL